MKTLIMVTIKTFFFSYGVLDYFNLKFSGLIHSLCA